MDTQSFWAPDHPEWSRMHSDISCDGPINSKLVNLPQQPQYTQSGCWSNNVSSCSEDAANALPWYASPYESDGPRTCDISPLSGYFDCNHSSNNTSPIQFETIVGQPSPHHQLHPKEISQPEKQSQFFNSYPSFRRSPCLDAPNPASRSNRSSLPATNPGPAILRVPLEQDTSALLPSPVSPSPKDEPLSEFNTRDIPEQEESSASRGGKRWKAAHRAVERRYRSNLNMKIIKLGQCIPAIRNQGISNDDHNGEHSLPGHKAKLQKGHVLSKAVDYIQSLQQRVSELETEKGILQSRIEALDRRVEQDLKSPQTRRQHPDLSRRHHKPQPLGADLQMKSTVIAPPSRAYGPDQSSAEIRDRVSPQQNGYPFVSANAACPSKQPPLKREAVTRM